LATRTATPRSRASLSLRPTRANGIRSNLFNRGHPLKAEPGLSDALDAHKRTVTNKIKAITDLDQMTDSFCERIIMEALVEPLVLHFDRMTNEIALLPSPRG
jgi:hypothetical protein